MDLNPGFWIGINVCGIHKKWDSILVIIHKCSRIYDKCWSSENFNWRLSRSKPASLTRRFMEVLGSLGGWFMIQDILPETNIAPKNGWLEDYFLMGWPIFRGELLVSGRVSCTQLYYDMIRGQLIDDFLKERKSPPTGVLYLLLTLSLHASDPAVVGSHTPFSVRYFANQPNHSEPSIYHHSPQRQLSSDQKRDPLLVYLIQRVVVLVDMYYICCTYVCMHVCMHVCRYVCNVT